MPLFKRGRGAGGWLAQSQAKRRKCEDDDDSSSRSDDPIKPPPGKLAIMSKIGYQRDKWHSLYKQLPEDNWSFREILRKEIGSFLNGAGGILCFGCRENGTIYGLGISREKEDNLRCTIDRSIGRFHPFVHPDNYRVLFRDVASFKGASERRMVIEIKITAPSRYIMYEDEAHEVYIRVEDKYKGPLTPHEIKDLVTDLYYKRIAAKSFASTSSTSNYPLEVCHTASNQEGKPSASTSSSSNHPSEICHEASNQEEKPSASTSTSSNHPSEICHEASNQEEKPSASTSTSSSHPLEVCRKASKQDDKSSASTCSNSSYPVKMRRKASKQGKDKPSASTSFNSSHALEVCHKASKQYNYDVTKSSNSGGKSLAYDVNIEVNSKPLPSSTTTGPITAATKTSGTTFKQLVKKLNPFGSSKSSKEPDSNTDVSNKGVHITRKTYRLRRNKKKKSLQVSRQSPSD